MKNESQNKPKEKYFDAVKTFRDIKDKISKDIADMNFEQIQAYLRNKKIRLEE